MCDMPKQKQPGVAIKGAFKQSRMNATVQLNSNLMLTCNEPREGTRESRAFYKITRFCVISRVL